MTPNLIFMKTCFFFARLKHLLLKIIRQIFGDIELFLEVKYSFPPFAGELPGLDLPVLTLHTFCHKFIFSFRLPLAFV